MRMKTRLLSIALAAFLTFAVAGQAKAYFEDEHLTMFFYTEGGIEVGYDLGNTATMDFTALNQVFVPVGTFDFLAETTAIDFANVNVGIYAGNAPGYEAWFVTTLADTAPVISMPNVSNFWNGVGGIRAFYTSSSDLQKVSASYGQPGSYGQAMNSNTTAPGFYAGFNPDIEHGELNLADADGLDDLYLYHFTFQGGSTLELDPGATTAHKAVIDIGLDGSVTMNANPVPIPGAAILLGSGLLGLVGIRRRKLA